MGRGGGEQGRNVGRGGGGQGWNVGRGGGGVGEVEWKDGMDGGMGGGDGVVVVNLVNLVVVSDGW